jgi:glycosyltransferase involved in cell wall biosynthesis
MRQNPEPRKSTAESQTARSPRESNGVNSEHSSNVSVFMMDLWATLPYYVGHLSRALLAHGGHVTIGSITYYLDRACFTRFGLKNEAGVLDVVGNLNLPKVLRRFLKLGEGLLNMLAWAWRFRKARPTIVHIQFLPLLKWRVPVEFWFLRYCQRRGIRLIYTVHDALPHDTGERYKSAYRRIYHMMDALICHSDAVRDQLRTEFAVSPDRISVIPHGPFFYDCAPQGVDTLRRRLAPEGECLVLWQGLIFPYKGIEFLLDSWAKVRESGARARLIIAGTGGAELLKEIRTRAARLNVTESVHFEFRFLPLEELIGLYQASDVVVYPYRAITTSGALMTGITQGKAIIATRLPAFSETLRDGENAILVDYGDTEMFAEQLVTLVRCPQIRASYAHAVRRMDLGQIAWDDIAEKTLACYRRLGRVRQG